MHVTQYTKIQKQILLAGYSNLEVEMFENEAEQIDAEKEIADGWASLLSVQIASLGYVFINIWEVQQDLRKTIVSGEYPTDQAMQIIKNLDKNNGTY